MSFTHLTTDRKKLAVHILRLDGFSADFFRQTTIGIAQNLEVRSKESVPRMLNEMYDIRANEERFERGEIGKYTTMKKILSILINH